jgi:RNA polymerase sigma factor for flagellar operon FliA
LSDREKTVVALYYDRELTLREIGAVLEVSESRVSQMLTAIAKKLRGLMNGDGNSQPHHRQRQLQRKSSPGEATCL